MEKQTRAKKNNNIRFREDKRLMVVGGLRSLALLGILATVIFCIWQFRDDLNVSNVRRIISYVKSAAVESDSFASYQFEAGLDTITEPFQLGLAVVSSDTYHFISGLGSSDFTVQLKYANPTLSAGSDQLLIYDRGNSDFCVANSYAVRSSQTLDSPIIYGSMNRAGDFCIVTNESGYKSAVTVYDKKSRQLCKWQTPDYYVMLASVNPDGDGFAAFCMDQAVGQLRSRVIGYAVDETTPSYSIDLGSRWVYSLKHDKSGRLVILCDDGVYVYDKDGQPVGQNLFGSQLVMYAHQEGNMPLLALRATTGAGEQTLVRVVDADGNVVFEKQYPDSLRDMDYNGGTAALLFASRLVTVEVEDAGQTEQVLEGISARGVLADRDGEAILIYSDRAEKAQLPAQQ